MSTYPGEAPAASARPRRPLLRRPPVTSLSNHSTTTARRIAGTVEVVCPAGEAGELMATRQKAACGQRRLGVSPTSESLRRSETSAKMTRAPEGLVLTPEPERRRSRADLRHQARAPTTNSRALLPAAHASGARPDDCHAVDQGNVSNLSARDMPISTSPSALD